MPILMEVYKVSVPGDLLRISTERVADTHYWSPDILSMESLSYRCATQYGGMAGIQDRSNATITMKAFVDKGWWVPDSLYYGNIYYTLDTEANAIFIASITLYLKKIDPPLSLSFDIFPEIHEVSLLEEVVDYYGNTVPLPMAFGNVEYVVPTRLPDAISGNQRRSSCGLVGTKHTHWHVFDDGIDVCSNATDIVDGVFEYTVVPEGEITVSGCGNGVLVESAYVCTFDNFLTVMCGASYLDIPLVKDVNLTFQVNTFATSQADVQSYMSGVAAANDSILYIHGGVFYAYSLTDGNFQLPDINVRKDVISIEYAQRGPVKKVTHTWEKRQSVSETIGQYVKKTEQEISASLSYLIGTEETVNLYEETGHTLSAEKISRILTYKNKMEFVFKKPLVDLLMLPGDYLDIYDYRYLSASFKADEATVIGVIYDFIEKEVTVEGYIEYLYLTTPEIPPGGGETGGDDDEIETPPIERLVDPNGEYIVDPDGNYIKTGPDGNITYPITDPDGEILVDPNGEQIVDPNPLPVLADPDGERLADPDGEHIVDPPPLADSRRLVDTEGEMIIDPNNEHLEE